MLFSNVVISVLAACTFVGAFVGLQLVGVIAWTVMVVLLAFTPRGQHGSKWRGLHLFTLSFLSGIAFPAALYTTYRPPLDLLLVMLCVIGVGLGALLKWVLPELELRTLLVAPSLGLIVLFLPVVLVTYGFALVALPLLLFYGASVALGAVLRSRLSKQRVA